MIRGERGDDVRERGTTTATVDHARARRWRKAQAGHSVWSHSSISPDAAALPVVVVMWKRRRRGARSRRRRHHPFGAANQADRHEPRRGWRTRWCRSASSTPASSWRSTLPSVEASSPDTAPRGAAYGARPATTTITRENPAASLAESPTPPVGRRAGWIEASDRVVKRTTRPASGKADRDNRWAEGGHTSHPLMARRAAAFSIDTSAACLVARRPTSYSD